MTIDQDVAMRMNLKTNVIDFDGLQTFNRYTPGAAYSGVTVAADVIASIELVEVTGAETT